MKTPLSPVCSETMRDQIDIKERQILDLVQENEDLKVAVSEMAKEMQQIHKKT
jgi:hypothetical protein